MCLFIIIFAKNSSFWQIYVLFASFTPPLLNYVNYLRFVIFHPIHHCAEIIGTCIYK